MRAVGMPQTDGARVSAAASFSLYGSVTRSNALRLAAEPLRGTATSAKRPRTRPKPTSPPAPPLAPPANEGSFSRVAS